MSVKKSLHGSKQSGAWNITSKKTSTPQRGGIAWATNKNRTVKLSSAKGYASSAKRRAVP